ncbi:MAG TPA: DUF4912 domain-containing protein [Nitrospiria bacterium]|nr:DUF4912 domain-containing protein [Nitrospiria bacterium]
MKRKPKIPRRTASGRQRPRRKITLETSTRQELLERAKRHKIQGRHRMTKAELVQALKPLMGPQKVKKAPPPTRVPQITPVVKADKPAPRPSYEELPESYGVTELVLLPVDPYWIHAYWEVTPKSFSEFLSRLGPLASQGRYLLRIYDVTAIEFDGSNAHSSFDLPIELSARNWYINLWSSEKSIVGDLGYLRPDGRFILLVRSNVIHTPRAGVSIFTEAPWAEPSALGGHGPTRLRFYAREPLYGPRPARRALKSSLWMKLMEVSRAFSQGVGQPSSPGRPRTSLQR